MSGWFAVKSGITSHPIFKGHPERLAIWIWLLDNAAWKDAQHDVNGKTITVPRGSVCVSERRLSEEVGVGYQVVRTFLARLKTEHMINARVTQGRNIISLCNYEKYQRAQTGNNAHGNAALTQDQRTKEHFYTSVTNVTGETADPERVIFDAGIALLASGGVKERQARQLLGKWKRDHGAEAVIAALGRAKREGAIDVVSFVEGCFRFKPQQQPRIGDTRKDKHGDQWQFTDSGWLRVYA